jgi:hypothetical protein
MIRPFRQVLHELEDVFRRLEGRVPPPAMISEGDGTIVRYQEKTTQQATLMKFARYISGLYALDLLLQHGFCQEVGVLRRTLYDISEDLWFLMYGVTSGVWTDHHKKYLEHFWMEGPGAGMVPRDKIRAYVHNAGGPSDPSTGTDAARTVFKGLSGYVHAGAVAIVDMCAGDPPRFHLAGMLRSPLYAHHVEDAWNPFYHGLIVAAVMARVFGDDELWDERYLSLQGFEQQFADKLFLVPEP